MKKPEVYVKRMIALEDSVIKESRKLCRAQKIPFHKGHEYMIRNAMREAVNNGVGPIIKEYLAEQKKIIG